MNTLDDSLVVETPQERGRRGMKFTYPPESKPLAGYTLKRGIQRGGFGEVYYAVSDAGKEVALKLLQHNLEIELRGVGQCLNLKHPHLVTIYDIRQDADGDYWIVMEYVHGKNLEQTLHGRPGGMPLDEAQHWLSGMAAGLTLLHERGIVHRDLKPANVYSESGVVKVGDVGLSKFITDSRRHAQTQSVGTVYYMAPEVAHGRYGREVDVYALGVVLYEMLTGRVPFDGESTAEILMKHLSQQPDLSPIPDRLRPVLARALEKDPERRYSTVRQLDEEFRRAAQGLSPSAVVQVSNLPVNGPGRLETCPTPLPVKDSAPGPARPVAVKVEPPRRPHAHSTHPRTEAENRTDRLWLALVAFVVVYFGWDFLGGNDETALVMGAVAAGVAYVGSRRGAHDSNRGQKRENRFLSSRRAERHVPRHRLVRLTPSTPRIIPLRHRMLELTGAMTFAAFAAAVLTGGLALFTSWLTTPETIALFGGTTLLGAWGVLVPSKLMEGRRVDGLTRRGIQLACGAAVGAATWLLSELLMVHLGAGWLTAAHGGLIDRIGPVPLESSFDPTLPGCILFFACLFGLRHWWKHADALRKRRFRVSSLLLTAGLGYLLTVLWSFPPLWGTTWAAALSTIVQVSAVWSSPEDRRRMVEEQNHA